jgi:hypothetical protein
LRNGADVTVTTLSKVTVGDSKTLTVSNGAKLIVEGTLDGTTSKSAIDVKTGAVVTGSGLKLTPGAVYIWDTGTRNWVKRP